MGDRFNIYIVTCQAKDLIFFSLKKDGGRSVWERSWRACVDKLLGQKSQGNNTGTPVPSRSGIYLPVLQYLP